MKLLDFRLPTYSRIQWASQELLDEWQPKIDAARQAYNELSKLAALNGLRKCSPVQVYDDALEQLKEELSKQAPFFFPISKMKNNRGKEGWHGVISMSMEDCFNYVKAHRENNENEKVKYMNIPDCCREFHVKTMGQGYFDPIWQYASNATQNVKKKEEHFIRIDRDHNYLVNPFLRYIGLFLLPYIPCSHHCEESIKLAQAWYDLGVKHEVQGLEELISILKMPLEWDCLKGIAYVSSPIFKVETSSLTCYPKYVIQLEGQYFPDGAPRGLKFPWNEYNVKVKRK